MPTPGKLHPEIAKVLATLPAPPDELDPVAMRAFDAAHLPPVTTEVASVEDAEIAGVPVRVYTPVVSTGSTSGVVSTGSTSGVASTSGSPTSATDTLVYFHGGAFFLGSLDTHDHIARALAAETGRRVVSVGYRLAPEHAFPAGLDDCYAVVREVAQDSPVAIAGDSSGGTYVAAVAAMAHDDGHHVISQQVLFYPSLDLDFGVERYPSLRENAVGYGLETAGLKPFNAFYIDSGADPADPRVSPIKREDLTGLPPALIITGEFDPLRDEAERYGERLREAGVEARVSRYEGAGHGFVQHFFWIPDYYRAFAETAEFLNGRSPA